MGRRAMRFEPDREADAIYITLREGVRRVFGQNLDDNRYIDFGEDNQPLGIELLGVSKGVVTEDLPERAAVERLARHKIKVFA
jgi:uncharacterized protein YuzE